MSDQMRAILEEIMTLNADDDGDVILFADEKGFNPFIHQIGEALGASQPLMIEIFPMNEETIADRWDDVTGWDVLVRPDGGDPITESEGLTHKEALAKADEMLKQYPFATIDHQLEGLLSGMKLEA